MWLLLLCCCCVVDVVVVVVVSIALTICNILFSFVDDYHFKYCGIFFMLWLFNLL